VASTVWHGVRALARSLHAARLSCLSTRFLPVYASPPTAVPDTFQARHSPSRRLLATVVEGGKAGSGDAKDREPRTLQIWENTRLVHNIDLTPHAAGVYADGALRSPHGPLRLPLGLIPCSAPLNTRHCRSAGLPRVVPRRAAGRADRGTHPGPRRHAAVGTARLWCRLVWCHCLTPYVPLFCRPRGVQPFAYRPSYGEGYGKKGASAIAIVDLRTGTVSVLPQWTHVGQVVFLSNDELAFSQLTGPSRGIKYCFNRPSRLVRTALDGTNDGTIRTHRWPAAAAAVAAAAAAALTRSVLSA